MIYHSKRILLTNSNDPDALSALNTIKPMRLRTKDDEHSPFVSMTLASILDMVRESHLIERSDGDIVCEKGDSGDQMFVILAGHVGVIADDESALTAENAIEHFGEGHVVGELGLGLQRTRTATLQAIGPTALLAIDYPVYKRLIEKKRSKFREAIERLISIRALEHMCRNTDFLAEPKSSARSKAGYANGAKENTAAWARLEDGTSLITYEDESAHSISPKDPKFAKPGLYILASGQLVEKSESEGARKVLSGEKFDVLYANLPHEIVSCGHEYRIDPEAPRRRVSVFRIEKEALQSYAGAGYCELVESISKRVAKQMIFDVFISYSLIEDGLRAVSWRDELRAAGLSVYMSQLGQPMTKFEVEINIALAESLVFMPIVSRGSSRSEWVLKEMKRRRAIFPDRPNIFPISLEDNIAAEMFGGIKWLKVGQTTSQEKESVRSAIETIKSVRSGALKPPLCKEGRLGRIQA